MEITANTTRPQKVEITAPFDESMSVNSSTTFTMKWRMDTTSGASHRFIEMKHDWDYERPILANLSTLWS